MMTFKSGTFIDKQIWTNEKGQSNEGFKLFCK